MSMQQANARARRGFCVGLFGAIASLPFGMACDGSDDESRGANLAGASSGGAPSGTATGQFGGAAAGVGSGASETGRAGTPASAAGAAGEGPVGGADPVALSPRLARYHRESEADRSLHFELDAVEGLSPYASSIDALTALLGRVLDKPDGIFFDPDETLPSSGQDHVWTFAELDAFSRRHAADDASGPVSVHVLLIDGRYDSEDDAGTVLGLAWGQRYIALFQDAIRSGCSGVLGPLQTETCELAERSVWAHEIGHVIGLVDNGIEQQTQHRDVERGRHDVSDGCLMYWAYETPAVFDLLLARLGTEQSPDVEFCENCWADLRAAQR